jgi:DNA-binding MarR family transcriptional regulator
VGAHPKYAKYGNIQNTRYRDFLLALYRSGLTTIAQALVLERLAKTKRIGLKESELIQRAELPRMVIRTALKIVVKRKLATVSRDPFNKLEVYYSITPRARTVLGESGYKQ